MPHLIANRPRLYDLTRAHPSARDQFRWEAINAVTYKLGGVVFLAGSALFLLGGLFNDRRAFLVIRRKLRA
ncbi:YrhK family protein [Microbaculum sp. FT89]|uniref:YrhK family protein n=1 Tax=Microbaculum sp. FT89 TaxID=3447298 RepID=UPI003F52AA36